MPKHQPAGRLTRWPIFRARKDVLRRLGGDTCADGHLRASDIEGTSPHRCPAVAGVQPGRDQRALALEDDAGEKLTVPGTRGDRISEVSDGRSVGYCPDGERARLPAPPPAWRLAQKHLRSSMTTREGRDVEGVSTLTTAGTARRGMRQGSVK